MTAADERHKAAVNTLHPVFKAKVDQLLSQLTSKGWQPVLVYGRRTEEQQRKKIAEGVGGKHSWHVASTEAYLPNPDRALVDVVRGCAADVIDRRWGWDGPCRNKNHKFWNDLGETAKSLAWSGEEIGRSVTSHMFR